MGILSGMIDSGQRTVQARASDPSVSNGRIDAGWYHLDGDPEGTIRRWNGVEWIGQPIPDPTHPANYARSSSGLRLNRRGALLSVLALVTLTGLAAVLGLLAAQLLQDADNILGQGSQQINDDGEAYGPLVGGIETVIDAIPNLLLFGVAIAATVLLAAVSFVMWINVAAATAQIHKNKQLRGHTRRVDRSTLSVVVQLVLFGLLAPLWWAIRAGLSEAARVRHRDGIQLHWTDRRRFDQPDQDHDVVDPVVDSAGR